MTVTARVRITIDIPADGSWSKDVGADQVRQQAGESALNKLGKALQGLGAKVVELPKVTMILAELENER